MKNRSFFFAVFVVFIFASLLIPGIPAVGAAIRAVNAVDNAVDGAKVVENLTDAAKAADGLPGLADDALVCRGGTCTADKFLNGKGVTVNPDGTLSGVSVNSAPGSSLEELTSTIPHKQVGVTTARDIRNAGGTIYPSPLPENPYHATIDGLTPEELEELFTPTIPNPSYY